ncbi:hypothetical protein DPMN_123427 [Dreissena polymorpha]|uniref:Uncharacterized protein n=1 Tax=Dreissena polymorpha TaxID=45954 RepID=A0A9D4JRI5_DREPO|nr:hypothetical protein DPMN_123427 [Dreissena polymorpha]
MSCINSDPIEKFELLFISGLKYIYEMTTHGSYQLRVDIVNSSGSSEYEVYEGFSLQHGTNYTLNVGSRIRSDGSK